MQPGTPPQNPGALQPGVQTQGQEGNNPDEVKLQYPNTDIQFFIKTYEELTGKHIMYDNSVPSGR